MPFSFKPLLACCAASLALAGCSHTYNSHDANWVGERTVGSGTIAQEEREVEAAGTLVLSAPVNVVLTMGEPALTVEADDNLLDFIVVEQDGGRLTILAEGTYTTRTPFNVYLSLPSLARIESPSAGDIEIQGWAAEGLDVESSGSGDITFEGALGSLKALARGSGDIDFSNSAIGSVDADANGSGDITFGPVGNLDARVSGSGDIIASEVGNLTAWNNGSGDILYLSAKNVEILNHTGSGDIRER
ncbi:DUF2807 domain-containing protein [Qipengyuania sp. 1XM1-15A]|uniref:GIN domain-containing protein n=1 Tax=Qipengyuania xiamenensis TaxID=2867237 RepID=UPI001C8887E1|nr:DUF2807 domain-containing protein [Qipengyuania xiamenensis]MBX7532807.1 DUF2807 domain-containing protein [Qipengyuania xiamenensis]